MRFEQDGRVVFIGDSITDCGRHQEFFPLGNGYVSIVAALSAARYPDRGIEFVNRGTGGNTIRDLARRWQSDVIDEKPSWLSVMIGVNDVWQTYTRSGHPTAVSVDEYASTYRRLLRQTREELHCEFVLIEPFLIESDEQDEMRRRVSDYASVVGALAEEFGTVHVRSQSVFDRLLSSTLRTNPALFGVSGLEWGTDRIHPTFAGHAAVALEILQSVDW